MATSYVQWGSVANSNCKVGLAIAESRSATQVTLTVEVWLHSASGVSDSNNECYLEYTNDSGSTVTTTKKSVSLSLSSNGEKLLGTHTLTYTRGSSDKTISLKGVAAELGSASYTASCSRNYTIAGKPSYTITYNPNGGSVSPTTLTGTYGASTTWSLATPTKTGHTFNGWYANLNGTSDYIKLGRQYMYTDKFSVHIEAYRSNWTLPSGEIVLIGCTESGGWCLYQKNGTDVITGLAYDSGYGYKYATSTTKWSSLSAGWHSFDLVFDGTYLYVYVDGTQIVKSEAFSSKRIFYWNTNSILIGAEAYTYDTPSGGYFEGRIRNVVIENSASRITNASNKFMAPAKNFTLIAEWTINKYYLDVNGWLDGTSVGNTSGYGTFDVYVNGSSVANDVTDFYNQYDYGSTYEIKDIKVSSGKTYYGVNSGSLTGTIGAGKVTTTLDFRTLYTVSYDFAVTEIISIFF